MGMNYEARDGIIFEKTRNKNRLLPTYASELFLTDLVLLPSSISDHKLTIVLLTGRG